MVRFLAVNIPHTTPPEIVPVTPDWAVWLPIVVGLAALALGYLLASRTRTAARASAQPVTNPQDLAAAAAADWARAEQGRPWLNQDHHSERTRGDSESTAERARLVASCADLADRLRDHQPALYMVLTRDLAAVGVTMEAADGEPFDERRHNPVGTEPTSDPAADLRVAATVRLGYLDHGSVVRTPDVIVYKAAADGHGGRH
jgi:molecular chaperone GrpE